MKIALIADIHANLHAFEVVLAHAKAQAVETIWNLGDSVGYGAFPDEVVQRLRKDEVLSVVGNYDLRVLQFKDKKGKWRDKKAPEKYRGFEWTYEHLSKKNRKFLRFLSHQVRMKVRGHRILLTHASPAADDEALTAETPVERLRELAAMAKADIVITGHSHRGFARQVGDVWFINPGSVGRPDDGDPRASYAILQVERNSVAVEHFRLNYDVERAVYAVRAAKLPELFAQMLVQGHGLESSAALLEEQVSAEANQAAAPKPAQPPAY